MEDTIQKFKAQIHKMTKDALIEYWHTSIKHSANAEIQEQYRCLMTDFKTMQQSGKKFTITFNF